MRLLLCGLALLTACDPCGNERCAGGVEPIAGDIESFTWDEAPPQDVTVQGPTRCEDVDLQAFSIDASFTGASPQDPGRWLLDELRPALVEAGLSTGFGAPNCDREGSALIVHSWDDANAVLDHAHALATEQDVEVSLLVTVEERPIDCPDSACGA